MFKIAIAVLIPVKIKFYLEALNFIKVSKYYPNWMSKPMNFPGKIILTLKIKKQLAIIFDSAEAAELPLCDLTRQGN